MKRIRTLLSLALILPLGVSLWASDKRPTAVFDSLSKDFGTVTMGELLRHVFKVTNRGDDILELKKVEASCGCTAALLSSEQVQPGKTAEVEVKVKTEGKTGRIENRVTVTTNDPRQAEITLKLSAVSEPEFSYSPRSLYFGKVPQGQEVTKELTVSITEGKGVKVLSVESTDENVTVKLKPDPVSSARKVTVVAVQKADTKEGYHFGSIVVKTSSKFTPELKIPVRGMVTAP